MNKTSIVLLSGFVLISVILLPLRNCAQKATYTQLWNEVDLVRAISDRWAAELDISGAFSDTPSEKSVLKTNTQNSFSGWVHYYHSARWKFSSLLGYYMNKDVPDIGQYKASEWRIAMQGTYYIHKTGYILNTDMRIEVRFLQKENGNFEDIYRYRQKLKFKVPLNSQILRGGVVYLVASEEVVFSSAVSETVGFYYFDRNQFSVGAGYLFTDDLQLELLYVNVFIPRDAGNEVDNVLSATFTVNNLITKLGKMIKGKPVNPVPEG